MPSPIILFQLNLILFLFLSAYMVIVIVIYIIVIPLKFLLFCDLDYLSAAADLLPQVITRWPIVHMDDDLLQRRDGLKERIYQRQRLSSGPRTAERIKGGVHCIGALLTGGDCV